jgi:hypothetical protein
MPVPPTIDFKLDAILLRVTRIEQKMTNYAALNAQVDATCATMSAAVEAIRAHVAELARAKEVNANDAVIDAIIAKLKVKTDELASVVNAKSPPPAAPVAPVVPEAGWDHPAQ